MCFKKYKEKINEAKKAELAQKEAKKAEKLGKKKEQISLNSNLVEDLGADSLDIVELIMAFEDEFGVSLPDEDIATMKTVADIVNYINSVKKDAPL